MHTVVVGKFGSGKSLYGVQLVVDELVNGNRAIVTTLALRLDRLNHYVQTLTDRDCQVLQRVLVINKEELGRFWRFRGPGRWGEYGTEPEILGAVERQMEKGVVKEEADPRWSCVSRGVMYVLDEAPVRFHARMWAETGIEFSGYMTQHRKVSDDVYSLARTASMLDKQFRQTADRCAVLDNWYQRAVGMFTAPRKIVVHWFENCPPGPFEPPARKEELRIDPEGLAGCYWTAKGLGVGGVSADIGKKAKGLPWWSSIVFVVLGVIVFWFGIHWAMGGALSLSLKRRPAVATAVAVPAGAGRGMVGSAASLIPHMLPEYHPPVESLAKGSEVYGKPEVKFNVQPFGDWYGYAKAGDRVFLETDSGMLEGHSLIISNQWAVLDGQVWRKAKRPKRD